MSTACPTRIKLRWPGWVALLIVLAVICLLGLRRPMPPVVILPPTEPRPLRLQRLVESGWAWLQFHLPGRRHSVVLRAKVFRFNRHPEAIELGLPTAAASTNGIQVWLLPEEQARAFSKTLGQLPGAEVLSQPSIQTLGGMRGSMAAGNRVVVDGGPKWIGVELTSFPKIRRDIVDLTSGLQFTESLTNVANQVTVKTNLAVRARIQISRGESAFVLGNQTDGKTIGVLLSATVQ